MIIVMKSKATDADVQHVVDRIKELQPMFRGEYAVILQNGRKLALGKTYREKVLTFLNK